MIRHNNYKIVVYNSSHLGLIIAVINLKDHKLKYKVVSDSGDYWSSHSEFALFNRILLGITHRSTIELKGYTNTPNYEKIIQITKKKLNIGAN